MKILLACSQYPPMKTGYSKVACELATWFVRFGHEVEVVTEGRGCSRVGKVAYLDDRGRELMSGKHDIVQVIGPTPFFSEQCVNLAKKLGLPVVYQMNAFPGVSSYYHLPGGYLVDSAYKRFYLASAIRKIDRAVVHTDDFGASCEYLGGNRYDVIPNGFDSENMDGFAEYPQKENNRVLFVGQLRQYKGLPYLIKAVKILRESGKDVGLDIVGEGPDRRRIERLIEGMGLAGHVQLHGELSDQDLDWMYKRSTVLVLPSVEAESFGIVLLEASVRGIPVIATNIPGVREVARAVQGRVVPPRDSYSLASALDDALSSPKVLGRRVIPSRMTRFLWQEVARRYLMIYSEILGIAAIPEEGGFTSQDSYEVGAEREPLIEEPWQRSSGKINQYQRYSNFFSPLDRFWNLDAFDSSVSLG